MLPISIETIDATTKDWQQGDCILEINNFVFGYSPKFPLTTKIDHTDNPDDEISFDGKQVLGFVVVTQTCDIVRTCKDRPYIEVCPLCTVENKDIELIRKYRKPQYAPLFGLPNKNTVADLDRTMTIEKSLLHQWSAKKIRGCRNEGEITDFAWALSRKRQRFAFPDEFQNACISFLKRMRDKHGKTTDEGKMISEFKEIRVRSAPEWGANNAIVTFYFLLNKNESQFANWADQIESWRKLINCSSTNISEIEMLAVDFDEITAREYKESMPLDLDALSLAEI